MATEMTQAMPQAPSAETANAGIAGYVTIEQAAKILGKTVGSVYMTLYRNRDRYPTVKMGNLHLIPNDTLMALFQNTQEKKA